MNELNEVELIELDHASRRFIRKKLKDFMHLINMRITTLSQMQNDLKKEMLERRIVHPQCSCASKKKGRKYVENDDDEEEGTPKKKKKANDYNIFVREHMQEVRQLMSSSEYSNKDHLSTIGKYWSYTKSAKKHGIPVENFADFVKTMHMKLDLSSVNNP